jgi:hypothetical protein
MSRSTLLLLSLLGCIDEETQKMDTGDAFAAAGAADDGGSADGGSADGGSADVGSADGGSADGGSADGGLPSDIEGHVSLVSGQVIDPKMPEDPLLAISTSLSGADSCSSALIIDNGIGQVRTFDSPRATTEWDGRDSLGRAFDTGTTRIALSVDCGDGPTTIDETEAFVVRLGLGFLDFINPPEEEGQIGLAFHKKSLFETGVSPVGDRPEYKQSPEGLLHSPLDYDDGTPRPSVPLWADPDVPPWAEREVTAHNVPTAFIAGSTMHAMIGFGGTAVSEARHIAVDAWGPEPDTVPRIRLSDGHATVTPNTPFHLPIGIAPDTMGKHIKTIRWTVESQDEDGDWHPVPGAFETHHAVYILAGSPALLDGSDVGASPAIPWIGVLEDTASMMEGVPATIEDTLDALRDYLFNHEYIIYDPSVGSYTEFEGPYMYWSSITAQISPFLDRREGLRLYCHSMSCMLSALAGNHGVMAEQIVLGVGFYTNYARAAGTDSWGRWSFNSHSVVTPDDGATIWDSSIALDGDDEPGDDSSIEEVMPRGMDGEDYMWRLTYDDIEIINQGLCYIE